MKNKTNSKTPGRHENKINSFFLGVLASWRSWILILLLPIMSAQASPVPDDFPQFIVPGHEKEMESVRALYWLHYAPAGPLIPLWDEWMPNATLWPARNKIEVMRGKWAQALSTRPMSDEGYVITMQHDGPAHAQGWPFPG